MKINPSSVLDFVLSNLNTEVNSYEDSMKIKLRTKCEFSEDIIEATLLHLHKEGFLDMNYAERGGKKVEDHRMFLLNMKGLLLIQKHGTYSAYLRYNETEKSFKLWVKIVLLVGSATSIGLFVIELLKLINKG